MLQNKCTGIQSYFVVFFIMNFFMADVKRVCFNCDAISQKFHEVRHKEFFEYNFNDFFMSFRIIFQLVSFSKIYQFWGLAPVKLKIVVISFLGY